MSSSNCNNCQQTSLHIDAVPLYRNHQPEEKKGPCKDLIPDPDFKLSLEDHPDMYDGVPDEVVPPSNPMCDITVDAKKAQAFIVMASQSPELEEIRAYGFDDGLVTIEDDLVFSGICEEEVEVEVETPCCAGDDIVPTCLNPQAETSLRSVGSNLEMKWMDALPVRAMTLLGRVGKKLAKLQGEGWLYLNDRGEVSASRRIPLKVTKLWHKFFASSSGKPFVGPPMAAPYLTVTDLDGNVYVVKGLPDRDSVMQWNHQTGMWENQSLSELPWCVSQHLQSGSELELVGFSPVPVGQDISTIRCPKRLEGQGMIYFEQIPSGDDYECECAPTPTTTTVAKFLPNPSACDPDKPPILAFVDGRPQWVEAGTLSCLTGPAGPQGEPGVGEKGEQGIQGATGVTNYQNACGNNPCA